MGLCLSGKCFRILLLHYIDTEQLKHNGSGVELRTLDYENLGWASFFTLHCSSSLSSINEYLAIDSGGYVFEQPSCMNCSIWLDASQRSRDGV